MITQQKEFCFCTLALGKTYRLFTQQLAKDLEKNSPGTFLVIYTDEPKDFTSHANVLAFKHRQQGILLCYHDKRLVMAEALVKFTAAIFIDADTRILSPLPEDLKWQPGITVGHRENLVEHVSKYTPERLPPLKNVASKLNLSLETTTYVGESLFVIARDEGREIEFFKYWGKIGRYLELKGIHSGEGNVIGLAAAKVGWTIRKDGWQSLKNVTKHLDASYARTQQSFWDKWKMKFGYHYRLNLAKISALQDFKFFYL